MAIDDRERTKETRDIWLLVVGDQPMLCAWATDEARALRAGGLDDTPNARAIRTAWRNVPNLCGPNMPALGAALVDDQAIEVCGLRYYLADRGRTHPNATKVEPMEPMEPDAEVADEALMLDLVERSGRPFGAVERGTLRSIRFQARPANATDADIATEGAHVVTRTADGSGITRIAPKPRGPRRAPDVSRMPNG